MKPEDVRGPPQLAQPPAGEPRAAVVLERLTDNGKIAPEFGALAVGTDSAGGFVGCSTSSQGMRRGVEPRADANQGAAVRLVAAMVRMIGGSCGESPQRCRYTDETLTHAEFGAKLVRLAQVMIERQRRLGMRRMQHDFVRDERIPVAIAA